jgi:hypothetical protein
MIAGPEVRLSETILSLVRRASNDLDVEKIRSDVNSFSLRHPDLSTREKAHLLVLQTARKAAAIGAAASLPPGWGAVAAMGPELTALAILQGRMIVGLHLLYGGEPDVDERASEILAGMAAGAGLSVGRRLTTRAAEVAAIRLAARAAGREATHLVPLLGAGVAAALNWATVRAVGRAVIERVERRYGPPSIPGKGPIVDVQATGTLP